MNMFIRRYLTENDYLDQFSSVQFNIQCDSKKSPRLRFSEIFCKTVGNF